MQDQLLLAYVKNDALINGICINVFGLDSIFTLLKHGHTKYDLDLFFSSDFQERKHDSQLLNNQPKKKKAYPVESHF